MTTVNTLVFCKDFVGKVAVEVKMEPGIGIRIVGMPDQYAKDMLLRVTTGLQSLGIAIPGKRITIEFAGKNLPRVWDWPELADYAVLVALSTEVSDEGVGTIADAVYLGEVGLNGLVYPLSAGQMLQTLRWYSEQSSLPKLLCPNMRVGKMNPYVNRGQI